MRHLHHTFILSLLLALGLSLTSRAATPPPWPAHLLMDPPTQAELDAQAALIPTAIAPLIRGTIYYDQDGDGSPESPQCDRGQRDLTITLYRDLGTIGVYEPGIDPQVAVTATDIIGAYLFDALPAPNNYLVMLDMADPDLPAGSVATTANPQAVALAAGQSKTVNLGIRIREIAAVREVVLSEIAWAGTSVVSAAVPPTDFAPETSSDEWLELYNTTGRTIDLTGWTLKAADGTPNISLRGRIPPHGYFLLERTDDTSAPAATTDQIYTGALSNSGEDLALSDGVTVIDRVNAWYAGDTAFHTMQRVNVTLPGTDPAAWANGPVNGAPQNSLIDADGDTYFYSPNPAQAAQSLDCNDNDPAIHPGAAESLDQVDQDCDFQVDEGLTLEPYASAVYFTDAMDAAGPTETVGPTDAALQALLDAATTSIDAAIYDFSRANLRDALINAHNRGVQVRIMGDDETYQTPMYQPFYQALEAAGIPVLYDMRGANSLQHNKFAVIDRATVWTGSFNWSDTAATYNLENAIAITSTHLAQTYTTEFAEMFNQLTGCNGVCKHDNTTHAFDLAGTPVESYFSPTDGVEQAILDELAAATESIHFAMFYLTSDPIGDLLVTQAITNGLTVDGIFDAVGAANTYSQDAKLCAAGLPIKVETFGGKVHHKFAVIDINGSTPRVVTGSYNWTAAGAESNDENTLIIHDAATAQAYYAEYQRLYQAIPQDAICSHHSAESGIPACQDGMDNDYDGLIDAADANCRESTPALCQDGLDNDGDGKTDTADLDCYRCRLAATGLSGGATVEAGDPLTLTLTLDPAVGPLTIAWSDDSAATTTATYIWNMPDVYTVTASATNWCKTVSQTLTVTVTPMPVPALAIGRGAESVAQLDWTYPPRANLAHYAVWRSLNAPYFTPGSCSACDLLDTTEGLFYPDTVSHGIGNAVANYFYRVRAVKTSGALSAGSNTVGEFDFVLTPGQ